MLLVCVLICFVPSSQVNTNALQPEIDEINLLHLNIKTIEPLMIRSSSATVKEETDDESATPKVTNSEYNNESENSYHNDEDGSSGKEDGEELSDDTSDNNIDDQTGTKKVSEENDSDENSDEVQESEKHPGEYGIREGRTSVCKYLVSEFC